MPGAFFTIGRGRGNDLVVGNPYVSGSHARLVRSGNSFVVEDMGSSSGTFVNGSRVSRQMVSFGDRVELSSHYRLDWNDPRLRNWMLGMNASPAAAYPAANQPSRQNHSPVHSSSSSGGLMMPGWLLTAIGSFFFFFYVLPIDDGFFLWNLLEDSFKDGMGFLFIGLAGIAVPILAHTTRGLTRAVNTASIGFAGLVLYFVSTGDAIANGPGGDGGTVLIMLSGLFLLGMMILNNVVISVPRHHTVRLIAGILASVYMALIITIQILAISEYSSIRSGAGFIISFSILGFLANLAGGIVMTINIKESYDNARKATLAQNIVLYTMVAQVMLFSFAMLITAGADNAWIFFTFFRMFGFILGLALLLGGGVADLIKMSNTKGSRFT